jgi:hypothetical protein
MIRHAWLLLAALAGAAAQPGPWSTPVEVRYEDEVCVSYQARVDGPFLVVRANVASGWHTFAMDNKRRADEKLDGKPALSVDKATEIEPLAGIGVSGPWYQSPPKDFSRPELRWFSWGFDRQALFAARYRRTGTGDARLAIRGQACTPAICKNIDVEVTIPAAASKAAAAPELDVKRLVPVRH